MILLRLRFLHTLKNPHCCPAPLKIKCKISFLVKGGASDMGQFIYGGNQSCLPLYSCALAFIPRVKLDTEGYCCGFSAVEDEATNKTV